MKGGRGDKSDVLQDGSCDDRCGGARGEARREVSSARLGLVQRQQAHRADTPGTVKALARRLHRRRLAPPRWSSRRRLVKARDWRTTSRLACRPRAADRCLTPCPLDVDLRQHAQTTLLLQLVASPQPCSSFCQTFPLALTQRRLILAARPRRPCSTQGRCRAQSSHTTSGSRSLSCSTSLAAQGRPAQRVVPRDAVASASRRLVVQRPAFRRRSRQGAPRARELSDAQSAARRRSLVRCN
jgi:hypothetical protein